MKNKLFKRTAALLLALVCAVGVLPLPASAASEPSAPDSITQESCDYVTVGGKRVKYESALSVVNAEGLPHVFNEQVEVPGYGTVRALCAYHQGRLGPEANGQKWSFKEEVTNTSLKTILTYVYSHTDGNFTDAGNAAGSDHWGKNWSDLWFMTAQAISWYYEYGVIKDVTTDREGFIEQVADEFLAAIKLLHETYNWAHWITDWDNVDIHTIIDSADNGVTGGTAYDYASASVNRVLNHPEYYRDYTLWIYEWDSSQSWPLSGDGGEMQRLLVAVTEPDKEEPVSLTVKKLEAGTNRPIPGVTFKVESADGSGDFSVTRQTGPDGAFTLTTDADNLSAGQYRITETAVPEGYKALTASQLVTVLPGSTADSAVTFYNEKEITGEGSIRKVDSDNPTVGIPGAVIRITSVKLDNGGSFTGTYITGAGGYISKEDLDFANLPKGSYLAEEITPPQGYILSSDTSKAKQTFVWDGEHDISLIFENSSKVKVQLKKVDESGKPLAGAIFVIFRDGQLIGTEETKADGTITVSNVSEGYYEFREVLAPDGYDCDRSPVGVHVNAEDLQGEQTVTVTKINYHKRSLTIEKVDAETGDPIPNTTFHVRGVNVAYENDVTTGNNGKVTLIEMPSGCYEVTETNVPSPYILDTNNRKTVWIDAAQGKDATVTFFNSKKPGLILRKTDAQTGEPLEGVLFKVEEVNGGYSAQHFTDVNGMIVLDGLTPGAYTVAEVKPKDGYVGNDTVHTVYLEADKTTTIELSNLRKPSLRLVKTSADGSPLEGVTFRIAKVEDGTHYLNRTTNADGEIFVEDLDPGVYSVVETATLPNHILDLQEHHVELSPGKTSEIRLTNDKRPSLTIRKTDKDTGAPVPGVTFTLRGTDGPTVTTEATGPDGTVTVANLLPGVYTVTEQSVPENYILDTTPQNVTLFPNRDATVQFQNYQRPTLKIAKVDIDGKKLTGAIFEVKTKAGVKIGDFPIGTDGTVTVPNIHLDEGYYTVTEIQAPEGYILDSTPHEVYLRPGKTTEVSIVNEKKPSLTIRKTDKDTGEPVPGVTFTLRSAEGPTITTEATGPDGTVTISDLLPGAYSVTEQSVPENYILDSTPQTVTLFPDRDATVQFQNHQRPTLKIVKVDINGKLLTGAVFEVKTKAGVKIGDFPVGPDGTVTVPNTHLDEGYYVVTEIQAPEGYILDSTPHEVYLRPGQTTGISITNEKKPGLTVYKIDSVVGDGIKGAKFQIWRGSDNTTTGDYYDLGTFYTDENGIIHLDDLDTGWYKIVELEPAAGYSMKEPHEQIVYVQHDAVAEVVFENTPLNAIVVQKYDSVTGEPLAGCTFQLRYLGGTSGTGGTIIGQKVTSKNGVAMWTGLDAGVYIVEEISAADGYTITNATETVYLADDGEQSVITVRFSNSPDGSLLIRKVCAVNPSVTLQNAEFKVMYADGTLIGDSNGIFRTNENGEIFITGLTPGKSVVVTETRAPDGFIIDSQAQVIQIKEGRVSSLTFKNQPRGSLIIQKRDSQTGKPLPGAEFRITTAAGCEVGLDGVIGTSTITSNGIFVTDVQGEIRISNLAPGAYVVTEIKAPDGYVIDSPSINVVIGTGGDTQTIVVTNSKAGTLVIDKRDSLTGKPLEGVAFKVTTSTGEFVPNENGQISSNGLYHTDKDGKIVINGVVGTLVVTETATIPGYTIDEAARTQTVVVNPNETQTIYFTNTPNTALVIEKYIEGTTTPLKGVTFLVTDSSGAVVGSSNGEYVTDANGRIVITDLVPGTTITVREIRTAEGFVLDTAPKSIKIKAGEAMTLRFYNQPQGTLVIRKLDSVTGALISGAQFQLTYANGGYVDQDNGHLSSNGRYTTDQNGEIRISGIIGTVVVKEVQAAPGYVIDPATQIQTVTVNPMDTQLLTFLNDPLCSLTITKLDSVTGKPVPGTVFEVRDGNGTVLGRYTTGKDGTATVTGLIPGYTYVVTEVKVPDGYVLNQTPQTITVTNGRNTLAGGGTNSGSTGNGLVFEDDPTTTLVIEKYVTGTTTPLKGVTFLVTDSSGAFLGSSNGEFITDKNGRVVIEGLEPGMTVIAREIQTVEGYVLDTTPKSIKIKAGGVQTLRFYNDPKGQY